MTGVVLLPRMRWWFRGPAKRVGDWIEFTVATPSGYAPSEEMRVGLRLARVRTPERGCVVRSAIRIADRFENDGIAKTSVGMDMMGTKPQKVAIMSDFDAGTRRGHSAGCPPSA